MELLNEFANWIGFKTAFGMFMMFLWMTFWLFLGLGFYYGNKPTKSK